MSAEWQPSEGGVAEICGLLQEYLNPSTDQRRIFQELERCSKAPHFTNYLTYILCNAQARDRSCLPLQGDRSLSSSM